MMSLCRNAQFYDVSDNIKLTEINRELNNHKDKYKLGDILFLGDEGHTFAIIDTMDDTLTYRLDDHATNLP